MNDPKSNVRLSDALIGQEPPVPADRYREYREQLERRLVLARRRETSAVRVLIALFLIAAFSLAAVTALDRAKLPPAWTTVVGLIGLCAYVAFPILLLFYLLRHRPSARRAYEDRQDCLMRELERKVDELSKREGSA